ncbi:hypothetical protein HDF13_000211 [Edaphobacter lichenicola]|uniref:Uncharacterized protein n=1 Tax=Tunturiibacter gelidiferens TaxID=3069689 RepID=A0ACC5NU15_9BACT|nr:hypothetical protein [Edaphobacter lichenicola]
MQCRLLKVSRKVGTVAMVSARALVDLNPVLSSFEKKGIRAKLNGPPSPRNFKFALKITALLRSEVVSLASRRLVLMSGIVED